MYDRAPASSAQVRTRLIDVSIRLSSVVSVVSQKMRFLRNGSSRRPRPPRASRHCPRGGEIYRPSVAVFGGACEPLCRWQLVRRVSRTCPLRPLSLRRNFAAGSGSGSTDGWDVALRLTSQARPTDVPCPRGRSLSSASSPASSIGVEIGFSRAARCGSPGLVLVWTTTVPRWSLQPTVRACLRCMTSRVRSLAQRSFARWKSGKGYFIDLWDK